MKLIRTASAAAAALAAAASLFSPAPISAMCRPIGQQDQIVVVDGDQRVFIYHRAGMEDLVLQAAIKGNGSDFGMLLPLPAVPDIRKVERAFFDDLFAMTRVRQMKGDEGMARAAAGMSEDRMELEKAVEVVKSDVVGPFETVVLKARKMDALIAWLGEHKYVVSEEDRTLMQSYLDKNWYFVAVKVTLEGQKQNFDGRAQPMGFRFATPEIVLPTRMASSVPGGMNFTIYVLTNTRVSLPGFQQQQVMSLARPVAPDELRSRPNLAAVLDGDILLSTDGAMAKLAEAQKAADPKMHEDFVANKYRGLFLSKFNGFFPKEQLAKGDVVFQRDNLLDAAAVPGLIDQLALAPAQAAAARQMLEAGGSEQLKLVEAGLGHKDYRVRRAVAEILGVLTDRRSAPALIAALKVEPDDFVKSGINRALQAMSGRAIRSHQVEEWEKWVAEAK